MKLWKWSYSLGVLALTGGASAVMAQSPATTFLECRRRWYSLRRPTRWLRPLPLPPLRLRRRQ